jgi:hypothetical protein
MIVLFSIRLVTPMFSLKAVCLVTPLFSLKGESSVFCMSCHFSVLPQG